MQVQYRRDPVADGRRRRGGSVALFVVTVAILVGPAFVDLGAWITFWHHTLASLFVVAAAWRVAVMIAARRPPAPPHCPEDELPTYTVIAPLFREAGMVEQLVAALNALSYPRDRLQVIIALEAVDLDTQAAVAQLVLPAGFEVLVVPEGVPQTKPRACNVALAQTRGQLVTIYDAEDRPDPSQLREAAARFAAGGPSLGCLQAPLRISNSGGFLRAQFANEYAYQFELLLPAMARFGLPFPLGGTSNHLRVEALRDVEGWDAFNVTEDAELGLRLASRGWRLDVMNAPTWENAPDNLYSWLPQRSRWLKGYLQTLFSLLPTAVGRGRLLTGMLATLLLATGSALVHLPAFVWLLAYGLFLLLGGPGPSLTWLDMAALLAGWSSAVLAGLLGAKRAGIAVRARDALAAPFYWPLLTIAMLQAAWRAATEPHHWDKTDHQPWPATA